MKPRETSGLIGLHQERDSQQNGDLIFAEVFRDVFESVRKRDGHALREKSQNAAHAVAVVKRQDHERNVLRRELLDEVHPVVHGHHVLLREHHGLGSGRRSGSEKQARERFAVYRSFRVSLVSLEEEFLPADDQVAHAQAVFRSKIEAYHIFEVGSALVENFLDDPVSLLIAEDRLCSAALKHALQFVLLDESVERNDHSQAASDGKIRQAPFITVVAYERDLLIREADVAQSAADAVYLVEKFFIRRVDILRSPALVLCFSDEGHPVAVFFRGSF